MEELDLTQESEQTIQNNLLPRTPDVNNEEEDEQLSPLTPLQKSRLIKCIIGSQVVCGTLYLNIVSFYPLFVNEHYNNKISTTMVSIAMSAF